MSRTTEVADLEAEIAALIKQAGESLRERHHDGAPTSAAPPLQPALHDASKQETGQ